MDKLKYLYQNVHIVQYKFPLKKSRCFIKEEKISGQIDLALQVYFQYCIFIEKNQMFV